MFVLTNSNSVTTTFQAAKLGATASMPPMVEDALRYSLNSLVTVRGEQK